MVYVVKLSHQITHKGRAVILTSVLAKVRNRNSFVPSHGVSEASGYKFQTPEEALAALDTLFDDDQRRVGFEIIPLT